ncbi:MAG: hypothetical protein FWG14_08890 [Peptococcaceae bacterium]|nr:hypothetical protein [Peptococcaceae bacterium]
MVVTYPVGYPIIDPKTNYLKYDLFTYLDNTTVDLPLCLYLEFASRLISGENVNARNSTKSHIGTLFIHLLTINIPCSFYVVIIIDVVYDLFIKKSLAQANPSAKNYNPEGAYTAENYNPEDMFPPGLDIYLAINGDFERENPRASTWFYYLLLELKTVPPWVVLVLTAIILAVNQISRKEKGF